MIAWRVHLVWLALALLGAAAWGKHVASRMERDFDARRSVPTRPPAARKGVEAAPPRETDTGPGPASSLLEPPSSESADATISKRPEARPTDVLTAEQIGALLRSKNRQDAQRGVRAIEKLADRATKLALLPIGATEQHSLHLPLCTDSLLVEAVALQTEGDDAVVVRPHRAHVIAERVEMRRVAGKGADAPAAEHVIQKEGVAHGGGLIAVKEAAP